jgi:hypothetical protein
MNAAIFPEVFDHGVLAGITPLADEQISVAA